MENEKNNQINNNEKKPKSTRKNVFVILLVILFCLVITLVVIKFGLCKKGNSNNIGDFSTNISEDVLEQNVAQSLYHDYSKGILTIDEYVKNMLYARYDKTRLPEKYKSKKNADLIEIDKFIDENYEKLSNDTLKYYIGKANLENITFELNKENASVKNNILDSLTNTVYADSEQVTNLNKAILSKNGNFVVWYTTTGDNKVDEKAAKKIADGLEKTASIYDDKFKAKYTFKSEFLSKGRKYENQVEVLKNQNIKEEYLESAMQVYLVNYTDDSLAQYMQGYGILLKLWNKLWGDDHLGSVVFPYMLIKPSSFDDMERLEQIYNHELFHHYQHNIFTSTNNISDDPYIAEATANFASSIVTEKTTNEGYLNEWAGTARIFSNNLLSDEWAEEHSIGNVGYALFVYLNNYSNYVENGIEKIKKSIYENDALKYLQDNATKKELSKIQENIAIKNLTQDYTNKNLNVDPDPSFLKELTIEETITSEKNIQNKEINKLALNYYLIDKSSSDQRFEVTLKRNTENVSATLIGQKNGKYQIFESASDEKNDYVFNTASYSDYDKLYVVVYNIVPTSKERYSLEIKNSEVKKEQANQGKDIKESKENNSIKSIRNGNLKISEEYSENDAYWGIFRFKTASPSVYLECGNDWCADESQNTYVYLRDGEDPEKVLEKVYNDLNYDFYGISIFEGYGNDFFDVNDPLEEWKSLKISNVETKKLDDNSIFSYFVKGENSKYYLEEYVFKYSKDKKHLVEKIYLCLPKSELTTQQLNQAIDEYHIMIDTMEFIPNEDAMKELAEE